MTRKTRSAPSRAVPGRRASSIASRAEPAPAPSFAPVPNRTRSDGWTPARQIAFIDALAEAGCVEEACGRVGMSTTSAYQLRRRPDAASFREAWEFAMDHAIRRLSDAVFARALHGVATPVFYKGEQVGERRRYDEKLAMFLLRYRDPVRYGAWLDGREARRHPDGAAQLLDLARRRVAADASAQARGEVPPARAPLVGTRHVTDEEKRIADEAAAEEAARLVEERERAERDARWERYLREEAGLVAAPPATRPGGAAQEAASDDPAPADWPNDDPARADWPDADPDSTDWLDDDPADAPGTDDALPDHAVGEKGDEHGDARVRDRAPADDRAAMAGDDPAAAVAAGPPGRGVADASRRDVAPTSPTSAPPAGPEYRGFAPFTRLRPQ